MRSEPSTSWQTYAHDADIGVRGFGPTLAAAFEQAALALNAAIADLGTVRLTRSVPIACEASEPELLLFAWLNEVIYEMVTRHMLFVRFSVLIDGTRLTATATGEAIDRDRHHPAVEPKGATLTDLRVLRREDGSWMAQCVIDV